MKRFVPLGIFAAVCVVLAVGFLKKESASAPIAEGREFPALALAEELSRKEVKIVNIFASWCLPCAVEQPALMALKATNLAPIYGIAWKNKPPELEKWLAETGNPYTQIWRDEAGEVTIPLGLTGVPETFIVDKEGIIAYHTKQPISQEMLSMEIIPLLERLQQP